MQIVRVPLKELVPDDRNARTHNKRNLQEIVRSLEAFGQHRAFVVQRGTNKVLIGNGMLEAMRQLGWTEADVFYVDDDDEMAVRRALADNRTAELADWDMNTLGELFSELNTNGGGRRSRLDR